MSNITLWDLAGAEDDRRFSPYCWRVRMAIAHKNLSCETVPWRFTEKDAIAFSGQGLVPVIRDGKRELHDSWAIAEYLDERHPDQPALFDGEQAKSLALFFRIWTERTIHTALFPVIIADLFANLHEKDKAYFRETREKRFGRALEGVGPDPKGALASLRGALDPVRPLLVQKPFVSGGTPAFADYILFGAFQWARAMSPIRLLEPDDPLYAWRERMLDLHDGLARKAKGYPVWV